MLIEHSRSLQLFCQEDHAIYLTPAACGLLPLELERHEATHVLSETGYLRAGLNRRSSTLRSGGSEHCSENTLPRRSLFCANVAFRERERDRQRTCSPWRSLGRRKRRWSSRCDFSESSSLMHKLWRGSWTRCKQVETNGFCQIGVFPHAQLVFRGFFMSTVPRNKDPVRTTATAVQSAATRERA